MSTGAFITYTFLLVAVLSLLLGLLISPELAFYFIILALAAMAVICLCVAAVSWPQSAPPTRRPLPMYPVAYIGDEFQRHRERILAIADLTVHAAGQTDYAAKQLTRNAIWELEAINREIQASQLPVEQQQHLRAQVTQAISRHSELLDIATQRSQQFLSDAIQTPLPRRSALQQLSDEINASLYKLNRFLWDTDAKVKQWAWNIDDTLNRPVDDIFRSRR